MHLGCKPYYSLFRVPLRRFSNAEFEKSKRPPVASPSPPISQPMSFLSVSSNRVYHRQLPAAAGASGNNTICGSSAGFSSWSVKLLHSLPWSIIFPKPCFNHRQSQLHWWCLNISLHYWLWPDTKSERNYSWVSSGFSSD